MDIPTVGYKTVATQDWNKIYPEYKAFIEQLKKDISRLKEVYNDNRLPQEYKSMVSWVIHEMVGVVYSRLEPRLKTSNKDWKLLNVYSNDFGLFPKLHAMYLMIEILKLKGIW